MEITIRQNIKIEGKICETVHLKISFSNKKYEIRLNNPLVALWSFFCVAFCCCFNFYSNNFRLSISNDEQNHLNMFPSAETEKRKPERKMPLILKPDPCALFSGTKHLVGSAHWTWKDSAYIWLSSCL